jgi:hypothetical protein
MSNRFLVHIYFPKNWIYWRKATLCLGKYGNYIRTHSHSVVTQLNSTNHDYTTNIIHKSLQSWYYVSSYQTLYTRTFPRVMIILFCWLVILTHTNISWLFSFSRMTVSTPHLGSILPNPHTTLSHTTLNWFAGVFFCVGWWYHFYCWVLEWVHHLSTADDKHEIRGCQR